MEFDDLFEKKYGSSGHHDDKAYDSHHSRQGLPDFKNQLLANIWNNPSNRKLVVVGGIVLLIFLILLVVLLLPVLLKLLQHVSDNGVKGVVDTLWNGTKE